MDSFFKYSLKWVNTPIVRLWCYSNILQDKMRIISFLNWWFDFFFFFMLHLAPLSTHTYGTMPIWEVQRLCAMRVVVGHALLQWDHWMPSRRRHQPMQSTRWVCSVCILDLITIQMLTCVFSLLAYSYDISLLKPKH
jgi:hypothetical protein